MISFLLDFFLKFVILFSKMTVQGSELLRKMVHILDAVNTDEGDVILRVLPKGKTAAPSLELHVRPGEEPFNPQVVIRSGRDKLETNWRTLVNAHVLGPEEGVRSDIHRLFQTAAAGITPHVVNSSLF